MNKLLTLLLFMLSTFAVSLAPEAYAADLEAGAQVFLANCAACHAGGNNAVMPEKTLVKEVLEENSMYTVEAITTQVKNGKNAMPAFGGKLADDDIDNVASYIIEQSKQGW